MVAAAQKQSVQKHLVYPFASQLDADHGVLELAACQSDDSAFFFEGSLRRPRLVGLLLRTLADVVHSRFYLPPALLAQAMARDPVVTSGDDVLRFEAFSSCCGVYARVDLDVSAADVGPSGQDLENTEAGAVVARQAGRGTTNVDFGSVMISALARMRDGDEVTLSVGADEVRLQAPRDHSIEKKVELPVRWLKGFVEVQACQARMKLVHEIPARDGQRFLRSIPKTASRGEVWIVPLGGGYTSRGKGIDGVRSGRVRLSRRQAEGGVGLGGPERLRLLDRLHGDAQGYRVYSDAITGACAFEARFGGARLHLVLSPSVWRGFSGEGQALQDLGGRVWHGCLGRVRAALRWQSELRPQELASEAGEDVESVRQALSLLGARGLVGYDLARGSYFHRELPFDLEHIEALQPRLRNARKLIQEARVQVQSRDSQRAVVLVGSGVQHRVRLTPEQVRCTCPWFSKHGSQRGPCKHILAAQIFLEEEGV